MFEIFKSFGIWEYLLFVLLYALGVSSVFIVSNLLYFIYKLIKYYKESKK